MNKILLSSVALMAMLLQTGCGGGSSDSDTSNKSTVNNNGSKNDNGNNISDKDDNTQNIACNNNFDLKVYPCNPTIPTDGELKLTVAYEKNGNIIENSDDNELFVEYEVENSNLIQAYSEYIVADKQTGKTDVTLKLKDENGHTIASREITVKVVEADVKNIFVNPDTLLLQKGETSTLSVTALNKEGALTSFNEEQIHAIYDPSQLHYTLDESTIQLRANNNKGFTEFTPIYQSAGYDITANSVIVAFYDKPNISEFTAIGVGSKLNLIEKTKANTKTLYTIYDNETHKALYYAYFSGTRWIGNEIDTTRGTIEAIQLIHDNDNFVLYALLSNTDDSYLDLIRYESSDFKSWSQKKIIKDSLSKDTHLDAVNTQYGNFVFISSGKDLIAIDTKNDHEYSFEFPEPIRSFDVRTNREDNIRIAISAKDGINSNIYYVEFDQENKTFTYTKAIADSIEGEVDKVYLTYNKRDVPFIFYKDGNTINYTYLYENLAWSNIRKINTLSLPNHYQDFFEDIKDFQVHIDRFNLLKLVVLDGENLYFIKEGLDKNRDSKWIVSKIAESISGSFDVNMDKKNRLTVMYESANDEWLGYWREPYYFKYRSKKGQYKTIDDTKLHTESLPPANMPPLACFTYDNEQIIQGKPFTLDANCSSDSDGHIVAYQWYIDGSNANITHADALQASYTTEMAGNIEVTLEVTDNRGKKDTETKIITVQHNPTYPTVNLTISPQKDAYEVIDTLQVIANAHDDGGTDTLTYNWFLDNTLYYDHNNSIGIEAQSEGLHTIKVEVIDEDNHKAYSEVSISRYIDQEKVEASLKRITNYARYHTNNTKPSLNDYLTIGATGVDANNLSAVNYQMSISSGYKHDTLEEIQIIIDNVNRAIEKIQAYADDQTKDAPISGDYKRLGITTVDNENITAVNYGISQKSASDFRSVKAIADVVSTTLTSLNRIANYAIYHTGNTKPSLKDYLTIGATGIDANNLSAVNYQMSISSGYKHDTLEEIQIIIDNVNKAIEKIKAYADDQTKDAPISGDYKRLGITTVDNENITAVNYGISQKSASDFTSVKAIADVVSTTLTSLNRIANYAVYHTGNTKPSLKDYLTIGATGIDANNISAVNYQMSISSGYKHDTLEEIQIIIDNVNKAIEKIQAYADDQSKDAPIAGDYNRLGITTVNNENITAVNYGISQKSASDFRSVKAIADVVSTTLTSLNRIANYAIYHTDNNPKPSLDDYLTIGIVGINSTNLNAVNNKMASSSSQDHNTVEEIQSIVDNINSNN